MIFDGSFASGQTPVSNPVRYIGWSNASNHFEGKIDEVRMLCMEYVEGKTLDRLIPDDGMSVDDFFAVALPL